MLNPFARNLPHPQQFGGLSQQALKQLDRAEQALAAHLNEQSYRSYQTERLGGELAEIGRVIVAGLKPQQCTELPLEIRVRLLSALLNSGLNASKSEHFVKPAQRLLATVDLPSAWQKAREEKLADFVARCAADNTVGFDRVNWAHYDGIERAAAMQRVADHYAAATGLPPINIAAFADPIDKNHAYRFKRGFADDAGVKINIHPDAALKQHADAVLVMMKSMFDYQLKQIAERPLPANADMVLKLLSISASATPYGVSQNDVKKRPHIRQTEQEMTILRRALRPNPLDRLLAVLHPASGPTPKPRA